MMCSVAFGFDGFEKTRLVI